MSGERWLPVVGFEELYRVSDQGRIYSVRSEKMLKLGRHRDGYLKFKACFNNASKCLLVHRVVASAFVSNPLQFLEIDHINGDKSDNAAANLEWVTRSQNIKRAYALGLCKPVDNRGSKNGQAVLHESDMPDILLLRGAGMTQQAIADAFGVSRRLIGMILKGERWGHATFL